MRESGLIASSLPLTSSVHLQLLDQVGTTLADYPLDTWADADGPEEARSYSVDGIVPYDPATAVISLLVEGTEVASRTVSANPPTVTLTSPAPGLALTETVTLRWSAGDPDGDPLTFLLLSSDDGGSTWATLVPRASGTEFSFNSDLLQASPDTLFRIVATDGVNTGTDVSDGPVTAPNRPPAVAVMSPVNGAFLSGQQTVMLMVDVRDPDGKPIAEDAIGWSSDVDGALGSGSALAVWGLSAGTHRLTVAVSDADGATASAQVTVQVDRRQVYLPLILR